MARARNIKPGFFMNDSLAGLDPYTRLLFIGLWTIADREGRLEDRPKKIKAEVLPYDSCDVDLMLLELEKSKFIIRYVVESSNYIQIVNFTKHQNPHKNESLSVIPEYSKITDEPASYKHSASTVQEPTKDGTGTVLIGLIPDSLLLIPDSYISPSFEEESDDSCTTHDIVAENIAASSRSPEVKETQPSGQPSSKKNKNGYLEEFEVFWSLYPKSVEKGSALKAWNARIREKVKPEDLIKAARNYADDCNRTRRELKYIKHPSTFLGTGKGYEDFLNGGENDATTGNRPEGQRNVEPNSKFQYDYTKLQFHGDTGSVDEPVDF